MFISVILSTFNNPAWLEKVLWGYQQQSFKDFEIVIADDGSDEATKTLIESFESSSKFSIQHAWHPDKGFQKCIILNKATEIAKGDYLVFTDGDCIPTPDFLATHAEHAEQGHFISGGYCKLPMPLSEKISHRDIENGSAFDLAWLKNHGLKKLSSLLKLGLNPPWSTVADKLTTTKPTWNGCNASTWKKDILAVNGHDERMQYGGEDREMGQRLVNRGLKPKQLRHRAVLIHLDHARSYISEEALKKNQVIRSQTEQTKTTWTSHGILKQEQP